MAITKFGRMKARVIEAHSSQQALVIKKTQLFDFLTDDAGNKNMDILLGFMCADLVGETKKTQCPNQDPSGLYSGWNTLWRNADIESERTKGGQPTEDEERRLQEDAQQIAPYEQPKGRARSSRGSEQLTILLSVGRSVLIRDGREYMLPNYGLDSTVAVPNDLPHR
jgi:hypothetical protein